MSTTEFDPPDIKQSHQPLQKISRTIYVEYDDFDGLSTYYITFVWYWIDPEDPKQDCSKARQYEIPRSEYRRLLAELGDPFKESSYWNSYYYRIYNRYLAPYNPNAPRTAQWWLE